MANFLKESLVQTIKSLLNRGWSQRRIARELGISRTTVAVYAKKQQTGAPAPTGADQTVPSVPTGSSGQSRPVPTGATPQNEEAAGDETARSQSLCAPFHDTIKQQLDLGLTAQRIYQDLKAQNGFQGGYDSVKRYVRRLSDASPEPFRRLECLPGEEAQVDFGTGAMVQDEQGKRRRTHLFRIVLSNSRKGYSEVVYRQDTESFIRVLENAFRAFGGVPKTLVPDNLKAAVIKADWADPELNPKLRDFCEHYGTVALPTKVRMPRHKGKVEAAVKYAQDNALKGRTFRSLAAQNQHLANWEQQVADTRIHGTTRRQVRAAFEAERPHLLPLPQTLFPWFEEAERTVHRDGHVEVAKAYYSAPPEYLRRVMWVRWDLRTVRIFNQKMEQVRIHPRVEPGRFETSDHDVPATKIAQIERGEHYLIEELSRYGDGAVSWARAMLKDRGIAGIRVLVGLLQVARKHPHDIGAACSEARMRQQWRLRAVRDQLRTMKAEKAEQVLLQQQHEIIRNLGEYSAYVDFTSAPKETA